MISNKTGEGSYVAPLYSNVNEGRRANLNQEFVDDFAQATDLEYISDGPGDLTKTFGPEDIFHYIYAVLHSPEYRSRYVAFLKTDFPRVPVPMGNVEMLRSLVTIGRDLADLHVMEREADTTGTCWRQIGIDQTVQKVHWKPDPATNQGRVFVNQGLFLEGVPEDIWKFRMGGYQPAQLWLKKRKGCVLTEADLAHYRGIIAALAETARKMAAIDEVIAEYGGWPRAFAKQEDATTDVLTFRPRIVDPDPYVDCLPLVTLEMAAGTFGEPQHVEDYEEEAWVEVKTRRKLSKGMFVAQVSGKSMEPTIPDKAYCLFRTPVEGSRQGKIVLVQLLDAIDTETGQRYTVKRYNRKPQSGSPALRGTIILEPINPDFSTIELDEQHKDELSVVAEFLEVLGG